MGLFINQNKYNDLYKNESEIHEPNQKVFIRNHVAEMIKEQQKVNNNLHHAFLKLSGLQEQFENRQTGRWNDVSDQLKELKKMNDEQDKFENNILLYLKKLEASNNELQNIFETERLSEQDFMGEIEHLSESYHEIANRLGEYRVTIEQLTGKISEQHDLQKQMAEQLAGQESVQEDVVNRLENQEALTEKIMRNIDYFRSILFERTAYLAEKIENGYNLTSSYIAKIMTGNEQPVALYMTRGEKREKRIDTKEK